MKCLLLVVLIAAITFISSCSGENTNISCGTNAISFATEVKPLTDSYCATNSGCHGSGSSHGVLTTYTQIFNNRSQISSLVNSGAMPQGGHLSTNQKSTIVCWIKNGAANN